MPGILLLRSKTASFIGGDKPLQTLFQCGFRAGEVKAHEPAALRAEGGAIVQADPRLFAEEPHELRLGEAQCAAIQPGQVSAFRAVELDFRRLGR